jgi:predicted transcriptional regulator
MTNRSREQIIASFLGAATFPVNKTTIMFKARLSYCQLQTYLDELQNKGLLAGKNGVWVVTEKGREYVATYELIKEMIESHPTIQVLR